MKRNFYWLVVLLTFPVVPAFATEPRSVLLLHSFGRDFDPWRAYSEYLQKELVKISPGPINFYEASVFTARFENAVIERELVPYLHNLFWGRRLDLVIAVGAPAMQFIQDHRQTLFPLTPLLIAGVEERRINQSQLTANDTVAPSKINFSDFVENILQVRPQTTHVAVIMGNSSLERYWTLQLRRSFQSKYKQLRFTWWNGLSVDEMVLQVGTLTPESVILYFWVNVDGHGVTHPFDRALTQIKTAAAVPIFGYGYYQLGLGIVGGPLVDASALAGDAAGVALRLLDGEPPSNIKTPAKGFGVPTYDWRELQRWKINESRLPAGSIVRFRKPTAWDQYRWQIILIAVAICILATQVVWLLYERRRRRQAEEEGRHQILQMKQMNRRAVVSEFSAAIAHEIRQPLAAMVSSADAALIWLKRKTPDLDETSDALRSIVEDGHRASKVMDSIRNMYRGDTEVRALHDVNMIVRGVIALLRSEMRRCRISVRSVLGEKLPHIFVNHVQIQQLLMNLILNAVDALTQVSDRRRVLTVRTEAEESGDVIITIADTGPGIDPENLKRIFDPFYTTKPNGTGMGLAISRSIVLDHGGRMIAELGKPHGIVFRVFLPAVKDRTVVPENR